MKATGALLMLFGALTALLAFTIDTTITSSGTYVGGTYIGGGSTYNLGLLQRQMMIFELGLAGFVAGAVLYAGAARIEQLPSQRPSDRWTDLRSNETEEERNDRLERRKISDRVIIWGGIAIILLLCGVALWDANHNPLEAPDYNVYENLTTNIDVEGARGDLH